MLGERARERGGGGDGPGEGGREGGREEGTCAWAPKYPAFQILPVSHRSARPSQAAPELEEPAVLLYLSEIEEISHTIHYIETCTSFITRDFHNKRFITRDCRPIRASML